MNRNFYIFVKLAESSMVNWCASSLFGISLSLSKDFVYLLPLVSIVMLAL